MKSYLPRTRTMIDKYLRHQELFLTTDITAEELQEMNQLQQDLLTYMIDPVSFNNKADKEYVGEAISTHEEESATTNSVGHVYLSSSTNSEREDVAATPKAVKLTYDEANRKMNVNGGTFTGVTKAHSNTDYTTGQVRNIFLSTGNPSGGANGDIWIKYV